VRRFTDFRRNQAGNTAIIFGLAIIPLLALGGGAVDLAHRGKIRGDLQTAADTAALAAARTLQVGQLDEDADESEIETAAEAKARSQIEAALASLQQAGTPSVDIDVTDQTVRLSAEIEVKTSFLGVVGIRALKAGALSEVNLPDLVRVEIVLALDYSGSMRDNDKYIRMRDAARTFIDRVKAERADRTKIGIVPFSEYVYASLPGSYVRGGSSTDGTSGGSSGGESSSGWSSDGSSGGGGARCLLNRDYPYSATDEPPYSGIDASKWPEGDSTKCEEYSEKGLRARDLTDDFDALRDALAGMEPVHLTNVTLAAEMAWHMLSPGQPFDTARDYSTPNLQKVLILLTDGMQTVGALGPSGEVSTQAADEVTAELCADAKELGVRIFTIGYDVNPGEEERVQALLAGCASGAASYFDARNASDISGVFDQIYTQIAESVWLSR
jgi:Flp pilus assembly protein TadG